MRSDDAREGVVVRNGHGVVAQLRRPMYIFVGVAGAAKKSEVGRDC